MAIFLFIFFLLLVCYALLIDYYRRAWNQIPDFIAGGSSARVFISVIIAARNEEKNLIPLIDSLRQQTYPSPQFEIIIVDDDSTDNTWNILQTLSGEAIDIRAVKLADPVTGNLPTRSHKKLAIERAIDLAKGELIVTTDADCSFGPNWLSDIAVYYSASGAKFIAAPVKIKTDGSFLSIFQALDFLTLQGITGASVYKRFHTMCNGANLAYEKKAFHEVGGFQGVDNIASGDDMLLMYKIYKRYPASVFYLKSKQVVVTTNAVHTWKDFFNQRIRWASKATHYDEKRLFWILLLVYSINLCFLVLAISSLWKATWLFFLLLLLAAKIIIEFPFVNAVAIFFSEKKLMNYFPIMQPFHILYTIIAGWLGRFGSYEWKGRRIKQ
ncbi:MAG: glycosyltransferase [Chitinophagaceae bacterium]|nr:glycosyltransferase [Chitinophagaceae bacterium]